MVKSYLELDKTFTTEVDHTESWGSIEIRVVVLSKKVEKSPTTGAAEAEDDLDIELEGAGPLDSYLEKPRGKGYVLLLVNGQRHDMLDESFVGRELGFKYLRTRTMIIADVDRLAPEAIAQLVQGSRQGFYKGDVYSAIVARLTSVLKADPDLKRLEAEAEQEIAELKSGDEAIRSRLDELIEGHHAAGVRERSGGDGSMGIGGAKAGISGQSVAEYVTQATPEVGEAASAPVLGVSRKSLLDGPFLQFALQHVLPGRLEQGRILVDYEDQRSGLRH